MGGCRPIHFSFSVFLLLEDDSFAVVYSFLLHNNVNQLFVHLYRLLVDPPSPPPIPALQVRTEHGAQLLVWNSSFPLAVCLHTLVDTCPRYSPNSSHTSPSSLCPQACFLCLRFCSFLLWNSRPHRCSHPFQVLSVATRWLRRYAQVFPRVVISNCNNLNCYSFLEVQNCTRIVMTIGLKKWGHDSPRTPSE